METYARFFMITFIRICCQQLKIPTTYHRLDTEEIRNYFVLTVANLLFATSVFSATHDDALYACHLIAKLDSGFDPADPSTGDNQQSYESGVDRCLIERGFEAQFTMTQNKLFADKLVGTWECLKETFMQKKSFTTSQSNFIFDKISEDTFLYEENSISRYSSESFSNYADRVEGKARLDGKRLILFDRSGYSQTANPKDWGPGIIKKQKLKDMDKPWKYNLELSGDMMAMDDVQINDGDAFISTTKTCKKTTTKIQPKVYQLAEYQ